MSKDDGRKWVNKEKCRGTFHPWRIYEPSDVKVIPIEEYSGYQSDYVKHYNHVMETGWHREEGRWVSPCGTFKYRLVYEAYRRQKFLEDILEGE